MKRCRIFLLRIVMVAIAIFVVCYGYALIGKPGEQVKDESPRVESQEPRQDSDPVYGSGWTEQTVGGLVFKTPMMLERSDTLSKQSPDPLGIAKFDCYTAKGTEGSLVLCTSRYKTGSANLDEYLATIINYTRSPSLTQYESSVTAHPVGNLEGKIARITARHGEEEVQFSSLVFTKGEKLWHFLVGGKPGEVDRASKMIFDSITVPEEDAR